MQIRAHGYCRWDAKEIGWRTVTHNASSSSGFGIKTIISFMSMFGTKKVSYFMCDGFNRQLSKSVSLASGQIYACKKCLTGHGTLGVSDKYAGIIVLSADEIVDNLGAIPYIKIGFRTKSFFLRPRTEQQSVISY
nr:hypothetical protein [Bacteroides sp.]